MLATSMRTHWAMLRQLLDSPTRPLHDAVQNHGPSADVWIVNEQGVVMEFTSHVQIDVEVQSDGDEDVVVVHQPQVVVEDPAATGAGGTGEAPEDGWHVIASCDACEEFYIGDIDDDDVIRE